MTCIARKWVRAILTALHLWRDGERVWIWMDEDGSNHVL
jgi:hypothetical protein